MANIIIFSFDYLNEDNLQFEFNAVILTINPLN